MAIRNRQGRVSPLPSLQVATRKKKIQEELGRLSIEKEQEARRFQAEAEAAVQHRLESQEQALRRRKDIDAVLVKQLQEKHQRHLEDIALERQASPSAFFCCKPKAGKFFVSWRLIIKATTRRAALVRREQLASQAKLGLQAEDRARLLKSIETDSANNIRIVSSAMRCYKACVNLIEGLAFQ